MTPQCRDCMLAGSCPDHPSEPEPDFDEDVYTDDSGADGAGADMWADMTRERG